MRKSTASCTNPTSACTNGAQIVCRKDACLLVEFLARLARLKSSQSRTFRRRIRGGDGHAQTVGTAGAAVVPKRIAGGTCGLQVAGMQSAVWRNACARDMGAYRRRVHDQSKIDRATSAKWETLRESLAVWPRHRPTSNNGTARH